MGEERYEVIAPSEIGRRVLGIPAGRVQTIFGIEFADLRHLIDAGLPEIASRAAVFVEISSAPTPEVAASHILGGLAEAALASWPSWYGGISPETGSASDALPSLQQVLPEWRRLASEFAAQGIAPRVRSCSLHTEVEQLSIAIEPRGLILVVGVKDFNSEAAWSSVVHILEWAARRANAAIAFSVAERPRREGALDRVILGALHICQPATDRGEERASGVWLAPVLGRPHPLSEIEQRFAAALVRDEELGPLFAFNQLVQTATGGRPRVDLLWAEGRLVVGLDGYLDHSTRAAFGRDRHRDYELMRSGYSVLRIANDEVAIDAARAVEKVRDIVRLRRSEQRSP